MISEQTAIVRPYQAQAKLLKVLTHPARLAILKILRDGEHCVCHIEAYLGFRQAYISQQLTILRGAGLITDRRDGWNVFYRIVDPKIFEVLAAVERMLPVEEYSPALLPAVNCPCPQCNTSSGL